MTNDAVIASPDFGYDPINLDDDAGLQTPDELRAKRDEFVQAARELRYMASTMETLATYCDRRAEALAHRKAGRIAQAAGYESWCDTLYRKLPSFARW